MMPVERSRRRRIDAMSIDVRLGTRDEEGPGLVQHIKAGKVDVATIHDVDGSGFRQEHIEGMNVVQLAIRRSWIKLGMLPRRSSSVCIFTARLGGAASAPTERPTGTERWSSSPGRRRYHGQVQPQFFVDVQRPRLGDEPLGQRRMDTPVAPFVGIGQRRAPDRLAEAHVIESSMRGPRGRYSTCRAGFRSVGQLGEGHWTGIARRRKASGPGDRRHTGRQIRVNSSPWQPKSMKLSEQGPCRVFIEHLAIWRNYLKSWLHPIQIDTMHFRFKPRSQ